MCGHKLQSVNMMTRKVAAKELEIRITMLTKELEAEKSYTQQLLQEHKEAEEEIEKVLLWFFTGLETSP